jgi:hypothetical protein
MSPIESNIPAEEFADDRGYFGWIQAHPDGYVLSIRAGKGPLLHQATCTHIDRHNNPGALTERGTRKICAEDKRVLREWVRANGLGSGSALDKCPSCNP